MMLIFHPRDRSLIIHGIKTQVRKVWDEWHVTVGSLQWATTQFYRPKCRFARLVILECWEEKAGDISMADVQAEGYKDQQAFFSAFFKIYADENLNTVVKCIRFARVPDKTREVRIRVVDGKREFEVVK